MAEERGIDVSAFQGVIDWRRVKEDRIDFAIIRVAAGTELDERFDYNIAEARRNDILTGVYLYTYARTEQTARDEAEFVLEKIKPYRLDLPVFYDIEDIAQHNLTKEQRTNLIRAFCERIEEEGYEAGVYSSLNWFNNYFYLNEIDEYKYWIADWDVDRVDFRGKVDFWQYTDTGRVDGISTDVDRDIWYRDESDSGDTTR